MRSSQQRFGSARGIGTCRRAALIALAVLLVGACSAEGGTETEPPTQPFSSTTAAQGVADPVETPCLSASPQFSHLGTVSILGGSRPDAGRLAGIDWVATEGCERIVFSFSTSQGAPASQIGLSRLEFAPEAAILRVEMPRDVDASAVADAAVEQSLVRRAFVVRSPSGGLSVDLHLDPSSPVEARGLIIGSPARLVVDVRASAEQEAFGTSPPTVSDDVVLLSPPPGAVTYPLRIRGYARTVAGVVTASVRGGGPTVERRMTAAPSKDAWGEYSVTIAEGPSGDIELDVATDRARSDGSGPPGVAVDLRAP